MPGFVIGFCKNKEEGKKEDHIPCHKAKPFLKYQALKKTSGDATHDTFAPSYLALFKEITVIIKAISGSLVRRTFLTERANKIQNMKRRNIKRSKTIIPVTSRLWISFSLHPSPKWNQSKALG